MTQGATAASSVLLARHLTQDDFGLYNLAVTLAALGTAVMTAGLANLGIRDIAKADRPEGEVVGALIAVRVMLALAAFALVMAVAVATGGRTAFVLTGIAGSVVFFRAADATELWFWAHDRARVPAIARLVGVAAALVARVGLLVAGAPLSAFVWLYAIEAAATSLLLYMGFLRSQHRPLLKRPRLRSELELIGSSSIMLVGLIGAQINARADIPLLQLLLGSEAVAIYSPAARLSEITHFIPVAAMTASFGALVRLRAEVGAHSKEYLSAVQRSYDLALWSGIGVLAVLEVAGPTIIRVTFGNDYAASGDLLRIHALALPLVFASAVFTKWAVAENHLWAATTRHLAGAATNLVLNAILIPRYGIAGAAWATVASYSVASLGAAVLSGTTRPQAFAMIRAFGAPLRWAGLRRP